MLYLVMVMSTQILEHCLEETKKKKKKVQMRVIFFILRMYVCVCARIFLFSTMSNSLMMRVCAPATDVVFSSFFLLYNSFSAYPIHIHIHTDIYIYIYNICIYIYIYLLLSASSSSSSLTTYTHLGQTANIFETFFHSIY